MTVVSKSAVQCAFLSQGGMYTTEPSCTNNFRRGYAQVERRYLSEISKGAEMGSLTDPRMITSCTGRRFKLFAFVVIVKSISCVFLVVPCSEQCQGKECDTRSDITFWDSSSKTLSTLPARGILRCFWPAALRFVSLHESASGCKGRLRPNGIRSITKRKTIGRQANVVLLDCKLLTHRQRFAKGDLNC